jgi:hypothetical protein
MPAGRAGGAGALAGAWIVLALATGSNAAGGAAEPGAYCPLPARGEEPSCLSPARESYRGFFAALEGEATESDLARVERDVEKGAAAPDAYLALSSLAYGYYRLAARAAATPGGDPAIVSRLERWNELLERAYASSAADTRYRAALRSAAVDLERRVDIELSCSDSRGERVECNSTEAVLRGFNDASERVGVRGALEQLIRRLLPDDES